MTKYILHGGVTSKLTDDNKKFFYEMTKGKDSLNVLCVCFSQPKNEWSQYFDYDKQRFTWAAPNKQISFECASSDNEVFKNQITKADVVYMRGGTTIDLLNKLKTVDGFENIIQDKVIGGSSAGACVLGKYYFTGNDKSVITEGLGILDIKVFVHYDNTKESEAKKLEEYGDVNLKTYRIPEEKFFTIE